MNTKDLPLGDLPPLVIGACEWVALPELGIRALRARVDTGARSCALHSSNFQTIKKDGEDWIKFHVHVGFERDHEVVMCQSRLVDVRRVRSTSGDIEERYTIKTPIVIGSCSWPVEITLTNREKMRYRMLLGRRAMKDHAIVYPARTFLQGKPDLSSMQRPNGCA